VAASAPVDRSGAALLVRRPQLSRHPGDTLASALLANGVRLVARCSCITARAASCCRAEEPNALVELRAARREPNACDHGRAYEGLEAARTAGRRCDSIFGGQFLIAPVLSAGFYYKIFVAGLVLEKVYAADPALPGSARIGARGPDSYEKAFFTATWVVGGGRRG
jgi:sarcosine oxidase subunit alpha